MQVTGAKPNVCVYITSRNYSRFLEPSIQSVFRQTYDSWQLILVNDCSVDSTASIMKRYLFDSRVKYIEGDYGSISRVANDVLERTDAKYIIRLDADDVFEENILLVLSNYLDKFTDHALVFPDYFLIDERDEIISQERLGIVGQEFMRQDRPPNGACTMIRREALQAIGGYDESLTAQDGHDIWIRLRDKFKCGNVGLPMFYYRRHTENMTNSSDRIRRSARNIRMTNVSELIEGQRPIIGVIPCRQSLDFVPNSHNLRLWGRGLYRSSTW